MNPVAGYFRRLNAPLTLLSWCKPSGAPSVSLKTLHNISQNLCSTYLRGFIISEVKRSRFFGEAFCIMMRRCHVSLMKWHLDQISEKSARESLQDHGTAKLYKWLILLVLARYKWFHRISNCVASVCIKLHIYIYMLWMPVYAKQHSLNVFLREICRWETWIRII